MTTYLYLILFIEIIIVFLFLYFIQIPLRKIKNKFLLFFLFLLKVILMIYIALILVALDVKIVWNHEYLFASLYLVLIADIFKDIICFIFSLLKKDKPSNKIKLIIAIILTVLFTMYNIINMQTILPKHHIINNTKLKHEYRLVFLSDLHYGSSQSKKTVDMALDKIKDLNPDYLLLGGDITDEYTKKEEMEYLYSKIGSLNIPTYYIYGNHDRQDKAYRTGTKQYSETELEKNITSNNITILNENYEEINDDLIILGREDVSHPDERKSIKDLPQLPDNRYVLVVDHSPYQNDEIKQLNADLQLSGHSHAGQLFPLKTIYTIIGLNVYGDYYIGNTHLYVSSGISGWSFPLRSEAHCYYEIIDLIPD